MAALGTLLVQLRPRDPWLDYVHRERNQCAADTSVANGSATVVS